MESKDEKVFPEVLNGKCQVNTTKKKVILINPSIKEIVTDFLPKVLPLAILSLASTLLDKYEIVLLDRAVKKDDKLLKSYLKDEATICVGISTLTGPVIKDAIYCSKLIRKNNPDLKIVWGGWHPTKVPESTLSEDFVDYIVTGEGEKTFKTLLSFIERDACPKDVPGVGYKEQGRLCLPKPSQLLDISLLPPLPFHMIKDIEPYIIYNWIPGGGRCIPLETSRGCPYFCSFCDVSVLFGTHYSYREARQIVDDIIKLKKMFDIGGIRFYDPNFFLRIERAREFANLLIENNIDLKWSASGTINQFVNVPVEDLLLFKRSGLRVICFGLESGDERIRREILNKKFTNDQCWTVIQKFSKVDIQFKFNMIIGFPRETYEEAMKTVDLALSIFEKYSNSSIGEHIFTFMPFPGIKLTETAKEIGFVEPTTLEGFSSISRCGAYMLPWLSNDLKKKYTSIALMTSFLGAPAKNIPFKGAKKMVYSLARRLYLFRLKKHWFAKTPDLSILEKLLD